MENKLNQTQALSSEERIEYAKMYANNTKEIYDSKIVMVRVIEKRITKGLPVEVEHLAKSSYISNLCTMLNKLLIQYESFKLSPEECKEISLWFAEEIIEDANYNLKEAKMVQEKINRVRHLCTLKD